MLEGASGSELRFVVVGICIQNSITFVEGKEIPLRSRHLPDYSHTSWLRLSPQMKAILTVLGVVFLIVAAMYFLVPADSLPTFFPGHETGLMRIRAKHGMLSGAIGIVLLIASWLTGRR